MRLIFSFCIAFVLVSCGGSGVGTSNNDDADRATESANQLEDSVVSEDTVVSE